MKIFSKYYYTDGGYDTVFIKNHLLSLDLIPIIKFNKYQQKIYNKRFTIEDTNGNIKSFTPLKI